MEVATILENAHINLTFIVAFLAVIGGIRFGYSEGFVALISHFLAIIAAVITLYILMRINHSYTIGHTKNAATFVIVLAILGAVYAIVQFLLKSIKCIISLPILNLINKICGIPVGILWSLMIFCVIITFALSDYLGVVSDYVINDVNNSGVLTYLMQYNIFLQFVD